MNQFKLQIVTPDGLLYDGEAQKIILRTTEGDVGILCNHADYISPLSIGVCRVYIGQDVKIAAVSGGMVSVTDGLVRVIATTFEWAENIDVERANRAKEKAELRLKENKDNKFNYDLAEIKLKKSLARIKASQYNK